MKNYILILIIALLTTACSYKDETITSKSGTMSVTQPAFWFEIDSLNDDADIRIGNPLLEAYFIIIREPQTDLPEGYTLEEYSQTTREYIKAGSTSYTELLDSSFTRINKLAAIKYSINATVENVDIRYWHVSLKSEKGFYQLIAWSLPTKFESNQENFTLVIDSFRELK